MRTVLAENRGVLKHTYVPLKLPHRTEMVNEITGLLGSPSPPNLFITGPKGSGKTATVKRVKDTIQKRAKDTSIAYVLATEGAYTTLNSLARECGIDLKKRGFSLKENWDEFESKLKDSPAIFFLDEVDLMLKKEGEMLLYYLSQRPNTCIVGISNRDRVLSLIRDDRIISRLGPRSMYFPRYDANQLEDILRDRVDLAKLKVDKSGGIAGLCAGLAFGKGERHKGDARYALELLDLAVDVAERAGAPRVKEEHVRIAEEEVETKKVQRALMDMEPKEKILMLHVIASYPEPQPTSVVYHLTNELAEKSEGRYNTYSSRMLYAWLRDLEDSGYVCVERGKPEPGHGRGGSTWMVWLSGDLNSATLTSMIKEVIERR